MEGRITLERDGHVATVTMDRPTKLNALTLGMYEALGEVMQQVSQARAYVAFSMMLYLAGSVSFFVTWMITDVVTTAERRTLREADL